MDDFANYIKNANLKKNQEEILKNTSEENLQDMAETVQDVAKKYENYSENDLKEEILKEVNKSGVNLQELEKIAKNIAPLMNEAQHQRLDEILNLIKK